LEFQENDKTGRLSLLDYGPVVLQQLLLNRRRGILYEYIILQFINYVLSRSTPIKMNPDGDRPTISPTTPGPGLAILCLCSAGASALVAGTAVLYQARLKRTNFKDLQMNWNVLLAIGLVCRAFPLGRGGYG
jgi:hypothetical protein